VGIMVTNGTIMQYFEWDLPNNGMLWKQLIKEAPHLSEKGITAVWIPPCYKGMTQEDVGYGAYDLYDLGKFDQKGTIRTKYGTRDELIGAINALHDYGIQVYADVVLNHKAGADETEKFQAVQVDEYNRDHDMSNQHEIEAWTHFYFPGREGTYSDFQWHWYHFTGVSRDEMTDSNSVYRIVGEGKGWANNEEVSSEYGNYDYLMFADVDFNHPEVLEETKQWITWFINETGIDGIRLDAVKHIESSFIDRLVEYVRGEFGEEFFFVAEYWEQDTDLLQQYLDSQNYDISMMDVRLHYAMHEISKNAYSADLSRLFEKTLVRENALHAVTFVDNHDSQPGQSLESFVEPWFKPLAYGIILLSSLGYPCIFYGDYYGYSNDKINYDGDKELIDSLLYLRRNFAYGEMNTYLSEPKCIGFTRTGNDEYPVGCAVVLSIENEKEKEMNVGKLHAGDVYFDAIGSRKDSITIKQDGTAIFPVDPKSISVWIPKKHNEKINNEAWM